jgi:hypothetical protein
MKKACQGLGFRGMLEGGPTYLVVCQSLLVNELQTLDEMNESNQEQVVVPHNIKQRLASSRGARMSYHASRWRWRSRNTNGER